LKVFKFVTEIHVYGKNKAAARKHMEEEFNYHFGQDNQLVAAVYLDDGVFVENLD